jgi:hypothetical protein
VRLCGNGRIKHKYVVNLCLLLYTNTQDSLTLMSENSQQSANKVHKVLQILYYITLSVPACFCPPGTNISKSVSNNIALTYSAILYIITIA